MKTKTEIKRISGSYRDPSGYVYSYKNRFFRSITKNYESVYVALKDSRLIDKSINHGYLIETCELDKRDDSKVMDDASFVLEHKRVPFISYPYEWTFSQLKIAALHHLEFQIFLLENNAILRDASAYNIQFIGAKPVFIDLPSMALYREGEYWYGYKQFCEQFLYPLLLNAKTGVSHNKIYRGEIEGISADTLAKLLPTSKKLSLNILLHVTLQAFAARKAADHEKQISNKIREQQSLPKKRYMAMLRQLHAWITSLSLKRRQSLSPWVNYASNNSYSKEETRLKHEIINNFIDRTQPNLLIDLGCNNGNYTRTALKAGAKYAVGYEFDHEAATLAYEAAKTEGLDFLPLQIDASNPSPSQGWRQSERLGLNERSKADGVLALAFVHHLAIAKNIPLDQAINWITDIAPTGLIEFAPKSDPMVQKMLAVREDIFQNYNINRFEKILESRSKIINNHHVTASGRIIIEYSNAK